MLVIALLGPRIAARRSPRTVAQLGLVAVRFGAIVMLATRELEARALGGCYSAGGSWSAGVVRLRRFGSGRDSPSGL
jgi:hypothetical protein